MANPVARALGVRAGNAGTPVAADNRPKIMSPKKGKGSYQRKAKHG